MKKQKSQFEKWFASQYEKPSGNYYKLIERRVELITELDIIEATISKHDTYNNYYNAARRTEAAAKRKYKIKIKK